MNVIELTGEEGNRRQAQVWSIMGPISFTIIVTLLTISRLLYSRSMRAIEANRVIEEEEEYREVHRLKERLTESSLGL